MWDFLKKFNFKFLIVSKINLKQKSLEHPVFPGGHPSKY